MMCPLVLDRDVNAARNLAEFRAPDIVRAESAVLTV